MADHHDSSYKNLFSHAELIKDLLQGFVHEPWVAELDFDSLERVNTNFVSDKLDKRDEDIIWRIKWRERWLYLYLLLAFQSTDDTYMAVRVMVYVGLLYQQLIREKAIEKQEKLPPVLPIVLYNGEKPWKSATAVQDLVQSITGFEDYMPRLSYLLLDERHYNNLDEFDQLRNLVAAIFQLEQSRTPQDIQSVVIKLLEWLTQPEQESIRRSFAIWLNRVLIPRRLPEKHIPIVESLNEVDAMLAETVQRWYAEAEEKGFAKGEEEGFAKGEEKGFARGEEKGVIKGREEGFALSLFRLLEIRFGQQPATLKQQLMEFSEAQLQFGLECIFNASSVEEFLAMMQSFPNS